MAVVPMPPYEPDVASLDAQVLATATNVFPTRNGYGPVGAPSAIGAALPAPARGAISVQSTTYGFSTNFAGTASKIYRQLANGTWSDETPVGAYGITAGNYWSFAVYGDWLIATPQTGASIRGSINTPGTWVVLGGSPPLARFNAVVGEFLVLGGVGANPNMLQWSDLGDPELWTPGAPGQLGDTQTFPDGGAVTGMVGGEFGIVFQQRCIRRMIYNPGSPTIFDFSIAEENRGCVSPSAVVAVGGQAFFLDREGFFVLQGSAASPIGSNRVNRIFAERVDASAIDNTLALRDPTGPRVIFAYRSKQADPSNTALLDEAFVYDWLLGRWSFMKLDIQCGCPAATPFTSIDALGGNVDSDIEYPATFDSPAYLGGTPGLGVFVPSGAGGALSIMAGEPLEATFETAEVMLERPERAYVSGIRFDTDASEWAARVGTRESQRLDESIRWRDERGPNSQQFSTCRASGRYHRARVRIPAGERWTYASAMEIESRADGAQ